MTTKNTIKMPYFLFHILELLVESERIKTQIKFLGQENGLPFSILFINI
jgi:hypothetical protein